MQYAFMTNRIIGSEDCLYLNMFVPQVVEACFNYCCYDVIFIDVSIDILL